MINESLTCCSFSKSPENNSRLFALRYDTERQRNSSLSFARPPTRDTSVEAQITGRKFRDNVINRPGRSSIISAAMDHRRFCKVSKTRPRRPKDPPPVRRHPNRIPNLVSVPFSLPHFLTLSLCLSFSWQFCNLPRLTFYKLARTIEWLSSIAILTCTLNVTHVTFDHHFSRNINADTSRYLNAILPLDQLYQLHERRASSFLKATFHLNWHTGNTSYMNEHIRVSFFNIANLPLARFNIQRFFFKWRLFRGLGYLSNSFEF